MLAVIRYKITTDKKPMDTPQQTGHNLTDSIIFTSFFLGFFGFLADYSKELVGFSAMITIILGLYRIYNEVRKFLKVRKTL